ncbi:MAG: GlsB/YeaQ/YmgE family stress response membrane protein, partial [Hyphomicrobiales bacterium]|nr:GlsB/YeaQ/YmgE family stress response membrane protein [Hyphomicrobiales bacterium]
MDQPVAFVGDSQPIGFFALIIIGGLAGWIAG